MSRPRLLSRRTVLRGAGVAVALPLLEAMTPAKPAAGGAPLRMAFVYAPNGKHMADWTPKTEGADFELPPTLAPLRRVKGELLVLSGLSHRKAYGNGDGPGDHARAMATFLTGCQARKTDGVDLRVGTSVDQVAAAWVGRATRFASIELGCEGGRVGGTCDHGYSCAYQTNLAWRSPSTPLAKETDPRLLFDRLFGGGGRAEGGRARRERDRRSVLDHAAAEATDLSRRLGAADRRRLDEYLTSLRDTERKVGWSAPTAGAAGLRVARPAGTPQDYREHARLMADLLALAFQADLTRVATFVLGNDGSNRSYREVGVAEGHHDLSHHGGDRAKQDRLRTINRMHVTVFAHLLERLQAAPEGGGTLLDRSMVVYGSGIRDGDRHDHDDLPILLAGRGGGLRPGRHLRHPRGAPLSNLYLSMLARMGIATRRFGDSTGGLPGLGG